MVTEGKDLEASNRSGAFLSLSVLRCVRMHVRTSETTGGARGVSRGERLWKMESGRVALPVTPVL